MMNPMGSNPLKTHQLNKHQSWVSRAILSLPRHSSDLLRTARGRTIPSIFILVVGDPPVKYVKNEPQKTYVKGGGAEILTSQREGLYR